MAGGWAAGTGWGAGERAGNARRDRSERKTERERERERAESKWERQRGDSEKGRQRKALGVGSHINLCNGLGGCRVGPGQRKPMLAMNLNCPILGTYRRSSFRNASFLATGARRPQLESSRHVSHVCHSRLARDQSIISFANSLLPNMEQTITSFPNSRDHCEHAVAASVEQYVLEARSLLALVRHPQFPAASGRASPHPPDAVSI